MKYAVSVSSQMTGKTVDPMLIVDAKGIQDLRVKLIRKYSKMTVTADVWTCDSRWGSYKFGVPIAKFAIQPFSGGFFWQPAKKRYAYEVNPKTGHTYHKMMSDTRWY